MILRRLLLALLFALPILLVVLAVLGAASALLQVLGDTAAAGVLGWAAIGCLLLIAANVVLLVLVLGVNALHRRP